MSASDRNLFALKLTERQRAHKWPPKMRTFKSKRLWLRAWLRSRFARAWR